MKPRKIRRKVQNGQVTIYGKQYRPQAYYMERDNMPLDGFTPYRDELEDKTILIGLYWVWGYNDVPYCYEFCWVHDVDNWYTTYWMTEQEWQDDLNDVPRWKRWKRAGLTVENPIHKIYKAKLEEWRHNHVPHNTHESENS